MVAGGINIDTLMSRVAHAAWTSILGFSCHVAWVVLFLLNPIAGGAEASAQPLKIAFLAMLIVAFGLGALLSDVINSGGRLLGLVPLGLVLGPLGSLLSLLAAAPYVYAGMALMAVGYVALSLVWGAFLSSLLHHGLDVHTSAAVAIGGALLVLAGSMWEGAAMSLMVLLPLISGVCARMVTRRLRDEFVFVSRAESSARCRIPARAYWIAALTGFILGVGACLVDISGVGLSVRLFAVGALTLGIGLVVLLTESIWIETTMFRLWVPRAALGLFPLMFVDSIGYLVCGAFLLFAFAWDGALVLNATAETTRFDQIAAVKTFGDGGVWGVSGLLAGWALTYVSFQVAQPSSVRTAVVLAVAYAIILAVTFLFQESYPSDETVVESAEIAVKNPGRLHARVQAVAQVYDLSPRQQEVLVLLAKGRNAEYIRKTFYISRGTAKAHIYTIYKKTNVHSHQELIDLIERTAPAR